MSNNHTLDDLIELDTLANLQSVGGIRSKMTEISKTEGIIEYSFRVKANHDNRRSPYMGPTYDLTTAVVLIPGVTE